MLCQHAKKVVSSSLGLVDFAIGLMNSVLNFSAQLASEVFLGNSNYRRTVTMLLIKKFLGGYLKDSWASTY